MFKRVGLFLLTNLAVMAVLGFIVRVLGVDRYLSQNGLDLTQLFIFALIFGFSGSIISLLMSKQMAKSSVGAKVITKPNTQEEAWLLKTVEFLSSRAGIAMPEVAIFEDASPNAFATGAFKNSALVALSRGLLHSMNKNEIEAVLAHEIGHVANGDMVTLSLLQGVVNTFVIFFARIIGFLIDRALSKDKNNHSNAGVGYSVASMVAEVVLGVLASLIVRAFSRYREYRADHAGATLSTPQNMIAALEALKRGHSGSNLPDSMRAFGINGDSLKALFSTHPSLDDRIARLKKML